MHLSVVTSHQVVRHKSYFTKVKLDIILGQKLLGLLGSAQSQGHYRLLEFTNISVPNQSLADMCPLLKWVTVDLRRNATSGGNEPSIAMGPSVVMGLPAAWFHPDLRHPTETRSKLALVKKDQRSICEVGLQKGYPNGPSTCIPSSSPSQTRFNPQ
jgi:hypothetical protein